MTDADEQIVRGSVSKHLVARMEKQCVLTNEDKKALMNIPCRLVHVPARGDIVRQGEEPTHSVFVLSGMLARYHTGPSGDRQYLSFHISGDMPDIQSLFLTVMDHSLCGMNASEIAMFPHKAIMAAFNSNPQLSFAFWRLTLIDAAIFRQTITNLGSRHALPRIAHFFCEQAVRAREAKLTKGNQVSLPLNQEEIGQALGLSVVSVNRNIQALRREKAVEFRNGTLQILNWGTLQRIGGFNASYPYAKDWT
jgi:CRP-like cAMP-binding protein